eukprot:s1449_g3.t1
MLPKRWSGSRALCFCGLLAMCRCTMNFVTGAGTAGRGQATARCATLAPERLHDPTARDEVYGQPLNVAKYLVDLHDAKAPAPTLTKALGLG